MYNNNVVFYIFIFASFIEFLQYSNILDVLGVRHPVARILIGSVFDVKDIVCYAVDCIILFLGEAVVRMRNKKQMEANTIIGGSDGPITLVLQKKK